MFKNGKMPFVIAEAAQAFEGSILMSEKLVDAAVEGGADAVKFQVFSPDELVTKEHPRYNFYEKIEIEKVGWKRVIDRAHENGIKFIADVFGRSSVDMLEKLNCDGYKIHSSDMMNFNFIEHVAAQGKAIIFSAGGAYVEELEFLREGRYIHKGSKDFYCLMHGFQSYPTKLPDLHIERIKEFKSHFSNLSIGFADHIDGDDYLAQILPSYAVLLGADVIEKHITLNRKIKGIDYYSSLEPREFSTMIRLLRDSLKAIGKRDIHLSKHEIEYRILHKKHIVASRNLRKGRVITEEDIDFKRTVPGRKILKKEDVIGKIIAKTLNKDDYISEDELVE